MAASVSAAYHQRISLSASARRLISGASHRRHQLMALARNGGAAALVAAIK